MTNYWMQAVLFVVVVGVFIATAVVTLRGITGKYQVRGRYLGPLVGGLLLEVAAVVIFMFQSIPFGQTTEQFVSTLPARVQAPTVTEARDKIRAVVEEARSVPGLEAEVRSQESRISELTRGKEAAEARAEELERKAGHFLVRLVDFHRDAAEIGNSVNLTYPQDPRKNDLARRLLELLAELGHYDGPVDAGPQIAKQVLIRYQRSKDFTNPGWYARPTFDAMVADHLALGLAV